MKKVVTFAVGLLILVSAREAAAQAGQVGQPWTDRGFVNVNIGFQSNSTDLNDTSTFRLYDEDASLAVAQSTDSGAFFDIGAGARVWRNVSAGFAFHQGSSTSDAAVSGQIPHPVVFNRNRSVALTATDLERTERALHLQFGYMFVVNDRLDINVFAGPSFFKVRQEVVSSIDVTEQGGDFSRVDASAAVAERSDTPVGGNIGADVSYLFYRTDSVRVGAGFFVRYASAKADIQVLQNTVESDLGGAQIGFGARIRF
jgi:hypothetical protein